MLCKLIESVIARTTLRHVLLLMLLLLSPALFSGLMGDDLFHYALLNGAASFPQPDDISLFHLFSFITEDPIRRAQLQDMSIMSWWISPSFSWNFWRPVAELSHYIDYVWLTDYPWLMHLHSILYFLAIVLLVYRVSLLLFSQPRIALLITALYALSATHGMTVAWLCNRNALLAMLFMLLSLHSYIRYQHGHNQSLSNRHYLLSVLFLMPALLSGELALSLGGFLFAYCLCFKSQSFIAALLRLTPHLAIVIIWYAIYSSAGFGAHGNTLFYINPGEHPLSYLTLLIQRIPLISLALLSAMPADIIGNIPVATLPLIAISLLIMALMYRLLRQSEYRKQALFFTVAGIIAIIPIACSPPQSRNLIAVSLCSAGLVALVIFELYRKLQAGQRTYRKPLLFLIIMHLIVSPLLLLPSSYIPKLFATAGEQRAQSFTVSSDDRVIVFDADMMEMTYLAANLFKQGLALPQRIWNLTGAGEDYRVKQVDDYTLRLTAGQHFLSDSSLLVRNIAAEPFHSGDTIALNGLTLHIIAVNDAGYPTIFDARFDETLDNYIQMRWTKDGYRRL